MYHALAPGRTRPPLDEVSIECTNGQVGVPPASCTEQPECVLQKSEWCQKGLFLHGSSKRPKRYGTRG